MPRNLGTYINDYDVPRKKDVDGAGGDSGLYAKIHKEQDYLYQVWYDDLDYDGAYEYFKTHADPPTGACSSVRNGNFYGRNFDWYYDNNAEFKVNVSATGGRYASQGMAGGFSDLTESFVSSGAASDTYKLVPFKMYDGINECGLTANINVVPTDNGTNVSIPTGTSEVEICGMMVIRYLLDHFDTAYKAVSYMQQHMTIYFTDDLHEHNYELHFMVADKTSTYIVEFVDNHAVVIDATTHPYMTNFIIDGVTFNDDGTVYTPETQTTERNAMNYNGISANGSGLERYNLIVGNYSSANTKAGMMGLMSQLTYSRAYTTSTDPSDPYWYTEFVGDYDTFTLNCASQPSEFAAVIATAGQYYLDRDRDVSNTWQTTHSVVYDISKCEMTLVVQESQIQHVYMLGKNTFTPEEWAAIQSGVTSDIIIDVESHLGNGNIHVTEAQKNAWDEKQDAIPANTYDEFGTASNAVSTHNASSSAHASLFSTKADKSTTYTKSEINDALDAKQDVIPANTYDSYGAAETAETAANAYTDGEIADVQSQIDALVSKSDVVDVVGTYVDLQNYDTTTLLNNDVVKVLSDNTHTDSRSYYRWVVATGGGAWSYIGSESVGYTRSETDTLLNAKQNTVSDLATIRSGAALGATAVQPISGKGLSTNDYTTTEKTKLAGIATGATAVSESTVSGWGFTKNTGTYSKPSSGIPKTDLASAVQTSLGKADNSVQAVSGKGLSTNDYTTAEKNKLAGIAAGANKTVIDSSLIMQGAAADAKAVGDALHDIVSDAWDSGTTYSAGGICIYENVLYKCLIDNLGQRPDISPTYWTATTVSGEFARITDYAYSTGITVASGSPRSNWISRYGRLVIGFFGAYDGQKTGNAQVVGTIPIGFRPSTNITLIGIGRFLNSSNDLREACLVTIQPDGIITTGVGVGYRIDQVSCNIIYLM